MRGSVNAQALLLAVLCVGGYLLVGTAAVVAVVLAGVALLAWQVAAASRPRPHQEGGPTERRSPGQAC